MSVTAVIVNFRTPDLTSMAVASVLADDDSARVIVVDNASRDGSEEALRARWTGTPVTIVAAPQNLGFGGGVNLGVASGAADDDVLVLNSDALVRSGCISRLRAALKKDSRLALAAPLVISSDGKPQVDAYGRFPTLRTMISRANRRPVDLDAPDWVSGVSFLIRREAFDAVNGFSPDYWMYFEDIDLCRRLRTAGWGLCRVRDAIVEHLGGASQPSNRRKLNQYKVSQQRFLSTSGYSPAVIRGIGLARRPLDWWRGGRDVAN